MFSCSAPRDAEKQIVGGLTDRDQALTDFLPAEDSIQVNSGRREYKLLAEPSNCSITGGPHRDNDMLSSR